MATRAQIFKDAKLVISRDVMRTYDQLEVLENARVPQSPRFLYDLSSSVKSVEFSLAADLLDDTVMGEDNHSRKIGLVDASATAELIQSFNEGDGQENIDALLNTLLTQGAEGTPFKLFLRPRNIARGPANPEYSFRAVLESHTPASGSVGEILMTSAPFKSAGGSVLRDVGTATDIVGAILIPSTPTITVARSASQDFVGVASQSGAVYAWSATSGSFDDNDQQAVVWTAPNTAGTVTVTLGVANGGATSTDTVTVSVT